MSILSAGRKRHATLHAQHSSRRFHCRSCWRRRGLHRGFSGTSTNRAEAGPPAPSALSIQQKASAPDPQDALDAGRQRLELVDEMRALRTEVAELKALLTSGRVRTNVGNFSEMPLEKIRLEIDYVKLRDAMKGN